MASTGDAWTCNKHSTAAQKSVQHRALAIAREASHARPCTSPQEVFSELLGPRCDYNGETTTVEQYDRSRDSLPPPGNPVPLKQVLDQDSWSLLEDFSQKMLLSAAERDPKIPGAYTDVKLQADRALFL